MIIDSFIQRGIDKLLADENEEQKLAWGVHSRLTASSLYLPERFQLLKFLGVPEKENDVYSLRKFARGRAVEDWYVSYCKQMGIVLEEQAEVDYRGVTGRVDMLVDSEKLDFSAGKIPHEIKSVKSSAFKYIQTRGEISEHYHIQACLYALALGSGYYGLDFICADDLREHVTIHQTSVFKPVVDKIINRFEEIVSKKEIPKWSVRAKWQDNPQYMRYEPEWATCSDSEFRKRLSDLSIEY